MDAAPSSRARNTGNRHSGPAAGGAGPLTVEIANASLSFGGNVLFSSLDFTLAGGIWTAILGPSGVGKSTLLRMIAGLAAVSPGTRIACADGEALSGRVAYMAQQDLLLPWMNLLDNVTIGHALRLGRTVPRDLRRRAAELLDLVGLAGRHGALPNECSGGMRQRAALARTLMEDRPVVLMDEPFSALDAITRYRMQELAGRLLTGRTVLLVTHDPSEAVRLSHRIYVMSGRPVRLAEAVIPAGAPPRPTDAADVVARQAELLAQLGGADADIGG